MLPIKVNKAYLDLFPFVALIGCGKLMTDCYTLSPANRLGSPKHWSHVPSFLNASYFCFVCRILLSRPEAVAHSVHEVY